VNTTENFHQEIIICCHRWSEVLVAINLKKIVMWKQCDMMSDDTGRGLISTGKKKPFSRYD